MARRSDEILLEMRDVVCRRGGRELFANFTTKLRIGESLRVAGPNGVGKSSLIRMVAGLLPCYQGVIDRVSSVALADERAAMDGGSTLRQMLDFWAKLDKAKPASVEAAALHFTLSPLLDVPTRMLSTGQRKRAALARCMASGAKLWLLDEPGNGLDQTALIALGSAMDAHVAGGGAIVAASHFDLPHRFTQTITLGTHHESAAA